MVMGVGVRSSELDTGSSSSDNHVGMDTQRCQNPLPLL